MAARTTGAAKKAGAAKKTAAKKPAAKKAARKAAGTGGFKRDLIIATFENGKQVLYQVAEADWKKKKASAKMAAELQAMLAQGAVVAAVPEMGHIGAACYLVSTASINVNPWGE
jgi:hypothetical protein